MMSFFIGVIVFLFVCWVASWPLPKEEPKEKPKRGGCAQAHAHVVWAGESEDGILHVAILREE